MPLRRGGSTKATRVARGSLGLGDGGEGLVELGVDLVGFWAEEDPGEDGLVELLAHGDRCIDVGGVCLLEQRSWASRTRRRISVFSDSSFAFSRARFACSVLSRRWWMWNTSRSMASA